MTAGELEDLRTNETSSASGDRRRRLRQMFAPRSVAVVGVSQDIGKVGTRTGQALIDAGFAGDIYFVNPKPGEFMGHNFVPSLAAIGKPVDLVVVAVPAARCPDVVEEAGKLGCGSAVVLANGFAEAGHRNLQDDLVARAERYGMPILGPNCMGLISAPGRLQCLPEPPIPTGRVAVVAQSGGVGGGLYTAARTHEFGLSYFISVGNQANIAFEDVLECLADDKNTDVVLLYVESFRDIRRFMEAAGKLAKKLPVVILRGGRSTVGARSAASHTGAMADDDAVVAAALRAAGLVEVDSTEELMLAAMALGQATMRGRSVSVIGDSGGYATLAADSAERVGISIEEHPEHIQHRLQEIVVARGSVTNPVDTVSGVDLRPDLHEATVGICLEDPSIDAVAFVGGFGGYAGEYGELETDSATALVDLRNRTGKPLVVQSMYASQDTAALRVLRSGRVPVVEHTDEAMKILSLHAAVAEGAARPMHTWDAVVSPEGMPRTLREDLSREWLQERLSWELPSWQVVENEGDAVDAVRALGEPAVMKVLADAANHKSDSGGVILNVRNDDEVRAGWRRIEAICQAAREQPRALVTKYVTGSAEALLGVSRHERLGPVVLIGTGGVLAESISDKALLLPPFEEEDVANALSGLTLGRALSSPRASRAMFEELTRLAVAIGRLAVSEERLAELDLNPVSLSSRGATVLDARVVVVEPNGRE